ncbi:unnamed protein product [Sordaria macrospora k-hell]|uniref:WGS project CABT00000000 data, contig 2.75 n=1 Tax=Sordaria macrospora (strain ATCC MYA-333 / DSM 997 / K(L3346) / K-hell) TaxID=771870 RepID=F7WBG3_SORMK|nr:uncharacterized protein SMAC_09185 [Sordaria macrospora k-hell]CCC05435.1 unnamed protein product [Sordaria macrospora k-hell]
MAIALPDSHKPKDRPEPRGVVITPEPAGDPETHHGLNDKTQAASDSLVTSLSKSSNPTTPSFLSTLHTLFTTLPSLPLSSPIWTLIEHLYRLPNHPPPRTRDPSRPMQIICVGFPRTGTESLAQALTHLGYSHVYHGWDVVYDPSDLCYSPGWVKLARKKFYPVADNHSFQFQSHPTITRADFEGLLGHCQAVTDAPASVFAAELIAAYPEAKVVLNMRRDEEKWQESLVKTIIKANESWGFWVASWLDRECFWAWHVYERFLWPALFRCVGGYGELGSVLLEWYIEDGWEPLCKFFDKEIPDIPFPHANEAVGGWKAREEQCNKRWVERAFVNLILIFVVLVFLIIAWWWF